MWRIYHLHMGDHSLLQPLIITTTTTSSTTTTTSGNDEDATAAVHPYNIIIRLVVVFVVAIISIWANYEASKGFEITVINDATAHTPAGRRFNLLFVSNDKITRIVLNTSEFAQNILYPPTESYVKKSITRVTVKLAGRNLTHPVVVNSITKEEFVLQISPSVMEERNVEKAVVSAVQRGMARIWLWNGEYGTAEQVLIDGIEEYVSISAGFGRPLSNSGESATVELPESDGTTWKDKNPVAMANFLNYCEGLKSGFIGRLNLAMRNGWNERTVDDALGMPAQQLCGSYHSFAVVNSLSSSSLM